MTQPTDFKFSVEPKDNRSPLIRFRSKLLKWEPVVFKDDDNPAAKERMSIKFHHGELVVIESHDPYPLPTADITISYSDRKETAWAAWSDSFRLLVPKADYEQYPQPFDILVGKEQEWFYKPARVRRPVLDEHGEPVMDASGRPKWGVQDADAWQIVALEGYGAASGGANLMDTILEYADGKKDQDILQWLYTDQTIKGMSGHQKAVEAAADRTLMETFIKAGKLTQDAEGVYHRA